MITIIGSVIHTIIELYNRLIIVISRVLIGIVRAEWLV